MLGCANVAGGARVHGGEESASNPAEDILHECFGGAFLCVGASSRSTDCAAKGGFGLSRLYWNTVSVSLRIMPAYDFLHIVSRQCLSLCYLELSNLP